MHCSGWHIAATHGSRWLAKWTPDICGLAADGPCGPVSSSALYCRLCMLMCMCFCICVQLFKVDLISKTDTEIIVFALREWESVKTQLLLCKLCFKRPLFWKAGSSARVVSPESRELVWNFTPLHLMRSSDTVEWAGQCREDGGQDRRSGQTRRGGVKCAQQEWTFLLTPPLFSAANRKHVRVMGETF